MTLDDTHRYWSGEGDARTEVPGVSRILSDMGKKSPWVVRNSEFYKTRGSYAHKAASLDDEGKLNMETVDPRVLPYLMAWRDFKKTNGVLVAASEFMVYNEKLRYAGTLDRIIRMGDRTILLDLKTGSKCRWHQLQVAAYWMAYGDPKIQAGVLYLRDNGKWSLDVLLPIALAACVLEWTAIVGNFNNMSDSTKEVDLWDASK